MDPDHLELPGFFKFLVDKKILWDRDACADIWCDFVVEARGDQDWGIEELKIRVNTPYTIYFYYDDPPSPKRYVITDQLTGMSESEETDDLTAALQSLFTRIGILWEKKDKRWSDPQHVLFGLLWDYLSLE